jgi:hypothetical protein
LGNYEIRVREIKGRVKIKGQRVGRVRGKTSGGN